jgi:hypothetical protein
VFAQVGETVRQCRIAGEKNAAIISLQKIAVVTAVSIPLPSRAPMLNRKCSDFDLASRRLNRLLFVPAKLRDVVQSCPSKQVTRARRSDYTRVFIETTQRSQVKMIKVRVGQKDDVDLWQLVEFECGRD